MNDDYWFLGRVQDVKYAAFTCETCRAHYDQHERMDLSCPAYTMGNGEVLFSEGHRYSGPEPRSLT